jgi:hypothetical protein
MKLKYQALGIFPVTHKKILKITEKNGMKISYYVQFLIDREFTQHGLTDDDLESNKS